MKKSKKLLVTLVFALTVIAFNLLNFADPAKTTQSELTLTVETDKSSYQPSELVRIFGTVKNSTGNPIANANIGIQVQDPSNNTIFLDIVFSESNGTYQDSFRLHSGAAFGEYDVYVTAAVLGYPTAKNQTTFTVGTPTLPVGGIWIPVSKLKLLAPYIGFTILSAIAVSAVGYVKKRKRHTKINSFLSKNNQGIGYL